MNKYEDRLETVKLKIAAYEKCISNLEAEISDIENLKYDYDKEKEELEDKISALDDINEPSLSVSERNEGGL